MDFAAPCTGLGLPLLDELLEAVKITADPPSVDADRTAECFLQALGVIRWDIYNGGIKEANVREQQARADEVHGRLFERTRSAEEDVRNAWSRLQNQAALAGELETQSRISDDLLLSYREQFNIGRRSLLDVLDAQNTRYNVQAQAETARMARLYAQYRVLAAENKLIDCLGVQRPAAAVGDQRERFHVNPIPPSDLQENSYPYPAMGPVAGPPAPPAPPPPPAADAAPAAATVGAAAATDAPEGR